MSKNRSATSEAKDHGVLFGSGLIAGEALMGIGLAGVIAANVEGFPMVIVDHPAPSLLIVAAIIAFYWRVAKSGDG